MKTTHRYNDYGGVSAVSSRVGTTASSRAHMSSSSTTSRTRKGMGGGRGGGGGGGTASAAALPSQVELVLGDQRQLSTLRREVQQLAEGSLQGRAKREGKARALERLGAVPKKGARMGAAIGLGLARAREKKAERARQEAADAGMALNLGKSKAKPRKDREQTRTLNRDGVLRVQTSASSIGKKKNAFAAQKQRRQHQKGKKRR